MGLKEKLMDKFMIEGRYEQLFGSHGIDVKKALKKAGLPEDTFSVQNPVVEEQAYYRFMDTLSTLSGDCGLPIRLGPAQAEWSRSVRRCLPPIAAGTESFSSKN